MYIICYNIDCELIYFYLREKEKETVYKIGRNVHNIVSCHTGRYI